MFVAHHAQGSLSTEKIVLDGVKTCGMYQFHNKSDSRCGPGHNDNPAHENQNFSVGWMTFKQVHMS